MKYVQTIQKQDTENSNNAILGPTLTRGELNLLWRDQVSSSSPVTLAPLTDGLRPVSNG
jgi:hypothetical protein